jgi:g-D-glutamyl-meso-diaminopimelate peptidase
MERRHLFIGLSVALLLALGIAWYFSLESEPAPEVVPPQSELTPEPDAFKRQSVLGTSVEGRPIEVFTYGTGDTHVLFVGGIHGGYEWNSVLLAYAFMDYLEANPEFVPEGITLSVIPSANPDGLFAVIGKEGRFTIEDTPSTPNTSGKGRFNAHEVDLNRNFDCKWQPESTWRGNTVSAGASPFSEPEAVALRDFVTTHTPAAVVFWHSQAGAVYASECLQGILPTTRTIMNAYAGAGGYDAVSVFDAYPITGDAEGWLASIGIPAITVELETRNTIEWTRNLAGISAVLETLAQ